MPFSILTGGWNAGALRTTMKDEWGSKSCQRYMKYRLDNFTLAPFAGPAVLVQQTVQIVARFAITI